MSVLEQMVPLLILWAQITTKLKIIYLLLRTVANTLVSSYTSFHICQLKQSSKSKTQLLEHYVPFVTLLGGLRASKPMD